MKGLTKREREMIGWLAEGKNVSETAVQMGISVHTARNHMGQIALKLDAVGRHEIVCKAYRLGLVS